MNSNDPALVQIGKRIYQCRKNLGLTQEDLAELADVTPQFVSFAESGKRAMQVDNIVIQKSHGNHFWLSWLFQSLLFRACLGSGLSHRKRLHRRPSG